MYDWLTIKNWVICKQFNNSLFFVNTHNFKKYVIMHKNS